MSSTEAKRQMLDKYFDPFKVKRSFKKEIASVFKDKEAYINEDEITEENYLKIIGSVKNSVSI